MSMIRICTPRRSKISTIVCLIMKRSMAEEMCGTVEKGMFGANYSCLI